VADEPEISIRKFRDKDAAACTGLIRACVEADADYPTQLKELLLRSESADAMRRRAQLFYVEVCETHSAIVGVGAVELNEIRLLYVSPESQGLGVGRKLLRSLEAMVPAALFSDIFVYSNPNAVGFYRLQGYRERGHHTFRIGDQMLPTMFMSKATDSTK
jgi:ribosomal protein S18 acetylase RimI-like enzyme